MIAIGDKDGRFENNVFGFLLSKNVEHRMLLRIGETGDDLSFGASAINDFAPSERLRCNLLEFGLLLWMVNFQEWEIG